MSFEQFKDEIYLKLGQLTRTPGGFHTRNCMMCSQRGHSPDTRRRFGIVTEGETIILNCFNCDFKAVFKYPENISKSFYQFLVTVGFTAEEIRKIKFELFRVKSITGYVSSQTLFSNIVQSSWKESRLPENSHSILTWLEQGCTDPNLIAAAEYLTYSRNILNLDKIYWTPVKDRLLCKRFIIPFEFNGKNVGYTARWIGNTPSKAVPKYDNKMPKGFLYNLDSQYDNDIVVVTEGVLDGFVTGGVSTLGSISNEQADLIDRLQKRVIVSPDRDAKGLALIDMALSRNWEVSFPAWAPSIKDAADACVRYGKLATVKSIVDAAERNPVSIQLKRRLLK